MFFVDIPTINERSKIIDIMNNRYGSKISDDFSENLQGWSGAEIEQLAKDSLFDGLQAAYENIVPLSKTMKEEITALREWAKTRARKANSPQKEDQIPKVRRIRE